MDKRLWSRLLHAGAAHPMRGDTITVRPLPDIPHTLECCAILGLPVWRNRCKTTLYEIVFVKNAKLDGVDTPTHSLEARSGTHADEAGELSRSGGDGVSAARATPRPGARDV